MSVQKLTPVSAEVLYQAVTDMKNRQQYINTQAWSGRLLWNTEDVGRTSNDTVDTRRWVGRTVSEHADINDELTLFCLIVVVVVVFFYWQKCGQKEEASQMIIPLRSASLCCACCYAHGDCFFFYVRPLLCLLSLVTLPSPRYFTIPLD